MTIDFISDLHLDKTRPEVNKYFINYLDNIDKDVTDLYILGDLFEYWVGDDDPMDGLNEIRASISLLGSKINVFKSNDCSGATRSCRSWCKSSDGGR